MVGAGMLMLLIAVVMLINVLRDRLDLKAWMLKLLLWAIALPFIANSTGWIFTEMGRMPWAVFGVMRVEDGVSTAVSAGEVLLSLIVFTLLYGSLMVADVYLLKKYSTAGISNSVQE